MLHKVNTSLNEDASVLTVTLEESMNPIVAKSFEGATVAKSEVKGDEGGTLHVTLQLGGSGVKSKRDSLEEEHVKKAKEAAVARGEKPDEVKKPEKPEEPEPKPDKPEKEPESKPKPGEPLHPLHRGK